MRWGRERHSLRDVPWGTLSFKKILEKEKPGRNTWKNERWTYSIGFIKVICEIIKNIYLKFYICLRHQIYVKVKIKFPTDNTLRSYFKYHLKFQKLFFIY